MVAALLRVRNLPTPGDISTALTNNPEDYTLALGHMHDLTFRALAYLRLPLAVAALACIIGAVGAWALRGKRAIVAVAVMMVLFFQAARLALVRFDPYLSSHALANVLQHAPTGRLIVFGEHNDISSLMFYSQDDELLLHGRAVTLQYGSNAPGAPQVFIEDNDFRRLWSQPERFYLAIHDSNLPQMDKIIPRTQLHLVAAIGGKSLFTNQELTTATR